MVILQKTFRFKVLSELCLCPASYSGVNRSIDDVPKMNQGGKISFEFLNLLLKNGPSSQKKKKRKFEPNLDKYFDKSLDRKVTDESIKVFGF
ncbi:hypothetical protein CEXT_572441 [Caerostris extrusa]|uniref:Uncharacterized protein n=1 Tax=Caerostris extrusa TaxID=172846 RepID=A0AAV4QL37_CAEEX|nr:hypothetical protein CEXT_572441 [Caerostris extrusa]